MKNNKKLIIGIVSILIVALVTVVVVMNLNKQEINQEEKQEMFSETIKIRDRVTKLENSKKSINVTIPEFQNLENDFGTYINNKIYNELNDTNVYEKAIEGWNEEEIGLFTYEENYQRYNTEDYLSIVANQYIHLGEGRPHMQKKCYVINTRENVILILKDMFKSNANYKDAILNEINAQAETQEIELIGGNGLTQIEETQAFYIKDNKLVIYFEASEIAATAVGELEFVMPFELVDGKFVI